MAGKHARKTNNPLPYPMRQSQEDPVDFLNKFGISHERGLSYADANKITLDDEIELDDHLPSAPHDRAHEPSRKPGV